MTIANGIRRRRPNALTTVKPGLAGRRRALDPCMNDPARNARSRQLQCPGYLKTPSSNSDNTKENICIRKKEVEPFFSENECQLQFSVSLTIA